MNPWKLLGWFFIGATIAETIRRRRPGLRVPQKRGQPEVGGRMISNSHGPKSELGEKNNYEEITPNASIYATFASCIGYLTVFFIRRHRRRQNDRRPW